MRKHKTVHSWREGIVDLTADYFELKYGQADAVDWASWILVARVARRSHRKFIVQFLITHDDGENSQIIAAVKQELDFYLVEKDEDDPWAYAQYHCGTAANIYSSVHWSFLPGWSDPDPDVFYVSSREKDLYASEDPAAKYREFQFPHRRGINRGGEFPVAVARMGYRERGYDCWLSAQPKEGVRTYLLEWMPRRRGDPVHDKMVAVFGGRLLDELHEAADIVRRANGLRRAGGDPDLFVQRTDDPDDRFFVEVKREDLTGTRLYRDEPNKQQRILFPLIEKILKCKVKLARVYVQSDARKTG